MPSASKDQTEVLRILGILPHASVRVLAATLDWQGNSRRTRLDTARVHRAILQLAANKLVEQDRDTRRWRLVRK